MSLKTPTGPLDIPVAASTPAPASIPGVSEESPPSKGLLINRNFALLAIGQAISNIGDFVYAPTLLVWVFVLTHSAGAVSGVWIAEYAPVFLLGPIAGVFVDRWNRRTTMIVADILRAMIALLPLFAPGSLRLPAIYTSIFLISGLARFFMPAKSGVLQVIVSQKQQPQAASISQATFALSFIVGPAIASPLYFVVGPTVALTINAATFVVSALSLAAMRVSKEALHPYAAKGVEHSSEGLRGVLRELAAGYLFVVKTRVLLMIVFLGLIAMLGAGALNALDIIFVNQNLHVSASLYGPLIAVGGVGTLLGAIIAGFATKKLTPKYLLVGGVFFTGVGIMVYSFLTWYPLALVGHRNSNVWHQPRFDWPCRLLWAVRSGEYHFPGKRSIDCSLWHLWLVQLASPGIPGDSQMSKQECIEGILSIHLALIDLWYAQAWHPQGVPLLWTDLRV